MVTEKTYTLGTSNKQYLTRKSLSDFHVWYGGEESFYPLKKAPQRNVWVYTKEK